MMDDPYKMAMATPEDMPVDLSNKTILQVIPSLETGGAERTTIDIARGIVAAGGKALVASAGGRLLKAVEEAGGRHITLPLDAKFRFDRHLRNRFALIRLCRDHHVDLIHARSRAPAFAALAAARRMNVPFFTTYHGIYSETNALKRWYNSVMVAGDKVIANSHYTKKVVLERYLLDARKVSVIHRGIDLKLFDRERFGAEEIAALKAEWTLPKGRPVILLLGRLTEWKGHFYALEALQHIKQACDTPPILVFAGKAQSETYLQRLKSKAFERGLVEDLFFAGHTDHPALAFCAADIAIMPSTRPEAFGRSVAEASACGLPVVAFDHGGACETILTPPDVSEDARTGERVPLKDGDALAAAILRLLKMPQETRILMGIRGRQHIEENFSIDRMVHLTLKLYEKQINRGA